MARRGPYEKGEAKREEILHVALEIFAQEGYRGTSLRKVAARCNLSLPGLMHYFNSKEDLLTQVLRARDVSARARHAEFKGAETYRSIIQEGANTPGLVELFVSMAAAASDTDHPAHALFAERYTEIRQQITDYLCRRIAEGAVRSDLPPERIATILVALADGIQLQWLTDRAVDMQEPIDDVMALLATTPDA